MHGVGSRIPVGQHQATLAVELAPIGLVAGIAVDSVEAGRRVGIDVVGLVAERAGQVHLDQC